MNVLFVIEVKIFVPKDKEEKKFLTSVVITYMNSSMFALSCSRVPFLERWSVLSIF